ncbi:Exportin-1 [Nosema granulosis]|uniref:Exportin-1 n=1 Tax=Nosema granulosis TaxID=83296 RepID=A0A9P6KZ51_9MICR|nr:Exportin-1 [Nosema granulosis]
MTAILNKDKELDIQLFDEIVLNSNNPLSQNKQLSEEALLKFKNSNNSWTKVDYILKHSKVQQSHYVALQILEEAVKTKWNIFDDSIKQGIREYVFQLVIEKSKTKECQNYVIQELNRIIVEMAKRDWPKRWPNFISDLINVSTSISMDVCKNTLEILKKLNEDVFFRMDSKITTVKKRLLRNQLKTEFPIIFNFIKMILEYSQNNVVDDSLLEVTLNTFASFCSSMPYDYIFHTNIVELVVEHINSMHSISCIGCLIEIVDLGKNKSMSTDMNLAKANQEKIKYIFSKSLEFMEMYLSKFKNEKIYEVYNNLDSQEKIFVLKLSQLFASIMELYVNVIEESDVEKTKKCFEHLVTLSRINDTNIFMCLFEMWGKFVYELYAEFPFNNRDPKKKLRRFDYSRVLYLLLNALVEKMPRPEEVFIVINEYGEVVKNKMIETEQIEFYRKMKSCFYHLAFLMEDEMKKFFITKVGLQLQDKEWSWSNINRLSWSIGCISGAFDEASERDFFVSILKYLLGLCEMKQFKADKAVIASNIMFIIGQFHRFLLHNKSFLKTVVKKLFEFMDEEHEGIKDMACDNFFKIAERCPREFLIQREEGSIFVVYILENLKRITVSLEFYQKRSVYEAILMIIKQIPTETSQNTVISYVDLLMRSMSDINIFSEENLQTIPASMSSMGTAKMISHILKSHSLVYKAIPVVCDTSRVVIFPNYFKLYELCNTIIQQGIDVSAISHAKSIKSNIIELFIDVVDSGYVHEELVTNLCERIIFDYKNYKEHLTISLSTSIVKKIPKNNSVQYHQVEPFIITAIIEPSLQFVMKADEHPDISINYLELIQAFLDESFSTFYSNIYTSSSFGAIYNSFLFSIVCMREISDLALKILITLFRKCYETNQLQFFSQNYVSTLENLLGIIFDRDMKYNFTLQTNLLALMIRIARDIPSLDGINSNAALVSGYIHNLFTQNFPNITQESLKIFISGLFELCKNDEVLREHIEDFSVKIYEFGNDEDLEAELALKNERMASCQDQ